MNDHIEWLGHHTFGSPIAIGLIPNKGQVVDIGYGREVSFLRELRRRRPDVRISAVDPDPQAKDMLEDTLDARVWVGAIAKTNTISDLYGVGKKNYTLKCTHKRATSNPKMQTITRTLRCHLIVSGFIPDYMKIDIEGEEFEITDDIISENVPQVAIEYHFYEMGYTASTVSHVMKEWSDAGYRIGFRGGDRNQDFLFIRNDM